MAQPDRPQKKKAPAWFIIASIVIFGVLVAICSGMINSAANKPEDPSIGATVACEQFVKDRLKAPSTADFSDENAQASGSRYIVSGKVDAENSFGAKLRNTFLCTVEQQPDKQWHLVDVQLA